MEPRHPQRSAKRRTREWAIAIGGGELAAEAARAGLLDEVHVVVAPAVVGGGTRLLPDGLSLDVELFDERSFGNGMVYLGYRVVNG